MFRYLIILTITLLSNICLSGQQSSDTDYEIYSLLIRAEIVSNTRSVTVVTKLNNDTTSVPGIAEAIKSKNKQLLEEIRFFTRDKNDNSINSIDTATQNLILTFYQSKPLDTMLINHFDIPYLQVFLINNFPIKNGSEKEWRKFYRKYPNSGGIFQLSHVYYSQDGKEAICYHSLQRRGLNAHGALAVLEKINDEWEIKYHITLWQA